MIKDLLMIPKKKKSPTDVVQETSDVASLDYVKRHDPSLFYHMQNWSEHARRLRVKQRMTQFRNDGHLE